MDAKELTFDPATVPFSAAGSYLALTTTTGPGGRPAVVLRTARGGRFRRDILTVVPTIDLAPIATSITATPSLLTMAHAEGSVTAHFEDGTGVVIGTLGLGASIDVSALGNYDTLIRIAEQRWEFVRFPGVTVQITVRAGRATVRQEWDGAKHTHASIDLGPDSVVEVVELHAPAPPSGAEPSSAIPTFRQFLHDTLTGPLDLANARALAAYVQWSAIVGPSGCIARPSMYMSKSHMMNIWSWDHCFNAMALRHQPALARDQFMTIFEHQDETGRLPDRLNDASADFDYVKPPIHGWTVSRMWDAGLMDDEWLADIYVPLERWTSWWMTERVMPGRRLPSYFHGCDSGWDNGTAFSGGPPVETPDLAAFLILQMETLARIAAHLGDGDSAEIWRAKSGDLLGVLLDELWMGDGFVARSGTDGAVTRTPSLLFEIPIILGERLPAEVSAVVVERIRGFLTPHGVATERVDSPAYDPDGYWRGPIWAPSTHLIVEGLCAVGEESFSREIARRFCGTVAASGMAECFDAVTGTALRDPAYTWTPSVFLLLAADYLKA